MRRLVVVLVLMVAGLVIVNVAGASTTATRTTFVAVLSTDTVAGCEETGGRGVAIVIVNQDGTLSYRVFVANLDDVISAHIHFGRPGETGGVAAGLFDAAGQPVDADGLLAQGTIADASLAGALLGGDPFYVNVHTTDCELGALRGQLILAGPR